MLTRSHVRPSHLAASHARFLRLGPADLRKPQSSTGFERALAAPAALGPQHKGGACKETLLLERHLGYLEGWGGH